MSEFEKILRCFPQLFLISDSSLYKLVKSINCMPHFQTVSMSRSRNFCFTVNNYTPEDEESIKCTIDGVRFVGYSHEIAPTTGTPHLQGVVCFLNARTIQSAGKALCKRAHLIVMDGTPRQAWTYCEKGADIWTLGTLPKDRSEVGLLNKERFKQFRAHAEAGDRNQVDDQMYIQYYSTFEKIAATKLKMPDNLSHVCGVWIYGKPGSGKSHAVNKTYPTAYRKMANKWWDSYQNEIVVWMDDLDPDATSWIARFLKIWADKWSFMAEVKGSSRCIRPAKFIVTSNYTIDQMNFRGNDLAAIKRRFVEFEKIEGQGILI